MQYIAKCTTNALRHSSAVCRLSRNNVHLPPTRAHISVEAKALRQTDRKISDMRLTLSLIKADLGLVGGHIQPTGHMLKAVRKTANDAVVVGL